MSERKNQGPQRFYGFAERYDRFFPSHPKELFTLIIKLSQSEKPEIVVDLGCGTGRSTRPWTDFASRIIGIEPSDDMITIANALVTNTNIKYLQGYGNNTGLDDNLADIVTCSASIHWMEPHSTIKEVSRILKKNGIFAVYGHYWPVIAESPKLTNMYEKWRRNLDFLEVNEFGQGPKTYNHKESQKIFEESNLFKYTRKLYLHSKIKWRATDFYGFINAHPGVYHLLSNKKNESELMLDEIYSTAKTEFAGRVLTIYFTYSVLYMIK